MSAPNSDAIAQQLRRLLPAGAAWLAPVGSTLYAVLVATADELARIYTRALDLLTESRPSTAEETLPEWETEWGLPDPCVGSSVTLTDAERRSTLAAKVRAVGGQSESYFVAVAAALGVPITIVYGSSFIASINVAGDVCGDSGGGTFHWTVQAPSGTSAALRKVLECHFTALKPAHTTVSFEYS